MYIWSYRKVDTYCAFKWIIHWWGLGYRWFHNQKYPLFTKMLLMYGYHLWVLMGRMVIQLMGRALLGDLASLSLSKIWWTLTSWGSSRYGKAACMDGWAGTWHICPSDMRASEGQIGHLVPPSRATLDLRGSSYTMRSLTSLFIGFSLSKLDRI